MDSSFRKRSGFGGQPSWVFKDRLDQVWSRIEGESPGEFLRPPFFFCLRQVEVQVEFPQLFFLFFFRSDFFSTCGEDFFVFFG